jgi:hypothetical protein
MLDQFNQETHHCDLQIEQTNLKLTVCNETFNLVSIIENSFETPILCKWAHL